MGKEWEESVKCNISVGREENEWGENGIKENVGRRRKVCRRVGGDE